MTELERRDLVVSGAVQRHQMRQWLDRAGIPWSDGVYAASAAGYRFRIDATSEQWEKINEWVEKVKA